MGKNYCYLTYHRMYMPTWIIHCSLQAIRNCCGHCSNRIWSKVFTACLHLIYKYTSEINAILMFVSVLLLVIGWVITTYCILGRYVLWLTWAHCNYSIEYLGKLCLHVSSCRPGAPRHSSIVVVGFSDGFIRAYSKVLSCWSLSHYWHRCILSWFKLSELSLLFSLPILLSSSSSSFYSFFSWLPFPSLLMIIRSSFPSPSSSSPLIHVFSSRHSFLSLLIFPTYVSLVWVCSRSCCMLSQW